MRMEAFKLRRGDTILFQNLPFKLIDVRHSGGGGKGPDSKVMFRAINKESSIVNEIVEGRQIFVVLKATNAKMDKDGS